MLRNWFVTEEPDEMSLPQHKQRPPKKTVSVEVRISEERKSAFLEACRRVGRPASEVIRELMAIFVIVQNVKWRFLTMTKILKPAGAVIAGITASVVIGASLLFAPLAAADGKLAYRMAVHDGIGEIVSMGEAGLGSASAASPVSDSLGEGVQFQLRAQRCDDFPERACASGHIFVEIDIFTQTEQTEEHRGATSLVIEPGAVGRFEATLSDGRTLSGDFQASTAE